MALSAKPTSYTVNTGHAKCPDHLYMLDDSTAATNCNDGVGSLDLTADATSMWNTDATYGQILRFVSASSQKAISGNTFAATSGICLVTIARSTDATNPAGVQAVAGVGHNSTANTYAATRLSTAGALQSVARYSGGTTFTATLSGDVYDGTWHMFASKISQSTGSDGQLKQSLDGGSWDAGTPVTTHDITALGFNRLALGCQPQSVLSSFFNGDALASFVYLDDYAAWDDAWIASLWADPWQFLTTTTTIFPQYGRRANTLLRM